MRDCQVCSTPASVETATGPATCASCRRAKYLATKRRYQQSEKGKATARAREERLDVRENRRLFSASEQGRINKAKYEQTGKGKQTRANAIAKYQQSEHGKQAAAAHHQATKNSLERKAQKREANSRYRRSDKGIALKRRDYARRKGAIVPSRPVTAADWLEIVKQHKNRCHYCGKKKPLTLDHVIPVTKGGLHVKENIVPACLICNSTKADKLIRLL